EVQYVEEDGHLYYLDYPVEGGGTIPVATARPETMVGDTGVAVHPDDWRYKDLIGKHVVLPIVDRRVPIVADEAVDQEFGTGAVKVTPGHDATDYDIGERHHLPVLSILTLDGRMNIPEVPQLHGLKVPVARERIVEMLRAEGALQKVEPYRHSVGHCDRCGAVIEPIVSAQWWVRMRPLAGPAMAVAESGDLRFHPERWREQYLRWMRNIRDILYLWVARMVFMSLHFLHVVPFSEVLIHGTVLAPDGRRMSKSLGTGVDPLDMIERYGADATRAWTAYFGTSGQDIRFSEEKIKSYQLFANKLWNATRLLVAKLPQ